MQMLQLRWEALLQNLEVLNYIVSYTSVIKTVGMTMHKSNMKQTHNIKCSYFIFS